MRGTAEARCCQAECESCARTACAVVTSPDHGRSAAMRRPAPWLHQHGRSCGPRCCRAEGVHRCTGQGTACMQRPPCRPGCRGLMHTVLLLSKGVGRQCVQSGASLQVIFSITWHCSNPTPRKLSNATA